jgi:hypothetical protein
LLLPLLLLPLLLLPLLPLQLKVWWAAAAGWYVICHG